MIFVSFPDSFGLETLKAECSESYVCIEIHMESYHLQYLHLFSSFIVSTFFPPLVLLVSWT